MAAKQSKLAAVGHIFKAVAPNIAQVVASTNPVAGALFGVATTVLSSHLKTDPTADAVVTALSGDNPDLAAVKSADNDFAEKMGQLGIDLEKLDVQDRESARSMAIARPSDYTQRNLAYWIVAFFCGYATFAVWGMIHYGPALPEAILTLITNMATAVLTYTIVEVKAVYGFFFGSSSGSEEKNQTVQNALTAVAQNGK